MRAVFASAALMSILMVGLPTMTACAQSLSAATSRSTILHELQIAWKAKDLAQIQALARAAQRPYRLAAATFLHLAEPGHEAELLAAYSQDWHLYYSPKPTLVKAFKEECGDPYPSSTYATWLSKREPCDRWAPSYAVLALAEAGNRPAVQALLDKWLGVLGTDDEGAVEWIFVNIDAPIQRLRRSQPKLLLAEAANRPYGWRILRSFGCDCCKAGWAEPEIKQLMALNLTGEAMVLMEVIVARMRGTQHWDDGCNAAP